MRETEFKTITPRDRADYRDLIADVSEDIWPEFMFHDPVADVHWGGLFEKFAGFQFALVSRDSGAIAGLANSVPLLWTSGVEELPDEGWDWALIKGAADYANGLTPNILCGLQISVAPDYQGKGLSRTLLNMMTEIARSKGLPAVIVPVRPSVKARYPLTSIDSYITWTNEPGFPTIPGCACMCVSWVKGRCTFRLA